MKTLLILRHAKSSWKDDDVADHERPLNRRGKRDAPRIGKLLHETHLEPELIISSTARRARKTAAKVAKACAYQGIIELDGTLYLAPADRYLDVLRRIPDHVQRVMIVGHNPGQEDLLARLTGQEIRFPTAALAYLQLETDRWSELADQASAQLVQLWRPADLEGL